MCRLERSFEGGCVFQIKANSNEELLKVEFTDKQQANSHWEVISNIKPQKQEPFTETKKEDGFHLVKLENFHSCKLDFKFTFNDLTRNKVRSVNIGPVWITGKRKVRAENYTYTNSTTFNLLT